MAIFQLFVAVLIVTHLVLLFVIVARIIRRHACEGLWIDDSIAGLTGLGVAFTMLVLLKMIIVDLDLRPMEYHLILGGFIFIIWISRACLVMATARLLHVTHRPKSLHLFWAATLLLLIFGIAFTFVTAFFCLEESVCSETNPCFCVLAPELVQFTLLTNVIVDLAMASTTYCIYMLDDFEEDPIREWVFYVGLVTGVCTFVLSLVFWTFYNIFRSHNYMLLLCLTSAVTFVSVLSSNALAVLGLVYPHKYTRLLSTERGAQEA